MRGETRPDVKLDAIRHLGIHSVLDLIAVEKGSKAIGENATSLDVRRKTGSVVVAVVRKSVALFERDPSFRFQTGDTVVLVGDQDALRTGSGLFRS